MKKLIEESGLSIKEFSDKYGIPYNTVRQWYNGARSAPDWLVSLIRENMNLLKHNQISIDDEIFDVLKTHHSGSNQVFYKIYSKDENWKFKADSDFWVGESKKSYKYPVFVETFQVLKIK
jgi:predicted transcriptional regulator